MRTMPAPSCELILICFSSFPKQPIWWWDRVSAYYIESDWTRSSWLKIEKIHVDLDGGRFFFNAVKEGDSVVFAADDEAESHLWVMALYRATGQSHKPAPPLTPSGKSSTIAKIQGGIPLSSLLPPTMMILPSNCSTTSKLITMTRHGSCSQTRNGGIHLGRPGQVWSFAPFQTGPDADAGFPVERPFRFFGRTRFSLFS